MAEWAKYWRTAELTKAIPSIKFGTCIASSAGYGYDFKLRVHLPVILARRDRQAIFRVYPVEGVLLRSRHRSPAEHKGSDARPTTPTRDVWIGTIGLPEVERENSTRNPVANSHPVQKIEKSKPSGALTERPRPTPKYS